MLARWCARNELGDVRAVPYWVESSVVVRLDCWASPCSTRTRSRCILGHLGVGELGPAGVVVEVADDELHVRVARLAHRLAVVHRLQHRHQAVVLLQAAGDGVEVAGARVA